VPAADDCFAQPGVAELTIELATLRSSRPCSARTERSSAGLVPSVAGERRAIGEDQVTERCRRRVLVSLVRGLALIGCISRGVADEFGL
jgi:hypothetical protein